MPRLRYARFGVLVLETMLEVTTMKCTYGVPACPYCSRTRIAAALDVAWLMCGLGVLLLVFVLVAA